jgi:ATP-grasp domain, R2K clade family 3
MERITLIKELIFLFPSDYFHPDRVDENYRSEATAFRQAGFEIATIAIESSNLARIRPPLISDTCVIYRGWMLSKSDYRKLAIAVDESSANLYTSELDYFATHYLPGWYDLIADLTPETHIYDRDADLQAELTKLGWDRFFIKDYVKSLKTSGGSIISDPSEIDRLIIDMEKFRGTIEGGICVRRVEDFIPASEQRYFVINGQVFSADPIEPIPSIAIECAARIKSRFFSIDTIYRRDGVKRIVEVGDGQVSGLVGWTTDLFVEICHNFSH